MPNERMSPDDVARALESHMDSIMQLLEAMVADAPDCEIKLLALLEKEHEQVRLAIIDKLRALLRGLAADKEKELEQFLEPLARERAERERHIILQWLTWLLSEETLRKISELFLANPPMERQLHDIGQALANFGVQQKLREQMQSSKTVATAAALPPLPPATPPERDKDKGSGRQ